MLVYKTNREKPQKNSKSSLFLEKNVLFSLAYVVDAIKYACKKGEKPVWNVSAVAIVVSILFCIYFFLPTTI